jgi:hypothetical protein
MNSTDEDLRSEALAAFSDVEDSLDPFERENPRRFVAALVERVRRSPRAQELGPLCADLFLRRAQYRMAEFLARYGGEAPEQYRAELDKMVVVLRHPSE